MAGGLVRCFLEEEEEEEFGGLCVLASALHMVS